MRIIRIARAACVLTVITLSSCSSINQIKTRDSLTQEKLIGTWRCDYPFDFQYVITRNASGSYIQIIKQRYDLNKLPLKYMRNGEWWVKNGQYMMTIDDTQVTRTSRKRLSKYHIYEVTSDTFRYLGEEDTLVQERRVQ